MTPDPRRLRRLLALVSAIVLVDTMFYAAMNLARATGQFSGSTGGAGLAQATADALPYLSLAALSAATLAVLARRAPAGVTAGLQPGGAARRGVRGA